MTETNNQQPKSPAVRVLTIIGFAILVIILAWFAVQVVQYIPKTFSSLASIFEANQRDLRDRMDDDDENVVVVIDPEETPAEEVPEEIPEETPITEVDEEETVVTPTPTTTPAPVQYKTVVTYHTPVSDPNGYTDLQAAFVAVGTLNSSGRFIPSDHVSEDEQNALQFTVKNIGTKTSSGWSFVAELPNGSELVSKVQQPLKPSETSTLTVVFEMDDSRGSRTAEVKVTGGSDINSANNSFRQSVRVK
ncbi:MAG: CARDB domain-containing protein [Candidatus Paceibacterota bacterium]